MNKDLIDQLIESRAKITNVRDEVIRHDLVDFIDAQLHQVPAGDDNRVDLLLGRQCAVLPERPDYGLKPGWSVNPVVTMQQPETIALIEQTRLIFEAAEPIEY